MNANSALLRLLDSAILGWSGTLAHDRLLRLVSSSQAEEDAAADACATAEKASDRDSDDGSQCKLQKPKLTPSTGEQISHARTLHMWDTSRVPKALQMSAGSLHATTMLQCPTRKPLQRQSSAETETPVMSNASRAFLQTGGHGSTERFNLSNAVETCNLARETACANMSRNRMDEE